MLLLARWRIGIYFYKSRCIVFLGSEFQPERVKNMQRAYNAF